MSVNFRQRSASSHDFAMVPRADIPRSSFRMQKTYKTTMNAAYLVPFFCEEILPGDSFNVSCTSFARLSTPIHPFFDNLYFETFFFFVPNRLVWSNWEKFCGEQTNPGDSTSFVIPQVSSPSGGWAIGSVQDYFGLPTFGQVAGSSAVTHNVLPLRGYNLIYNEWFRDQNLQNSAAVAVDDGPDTAGNYVLRKRGKRHDYFTSCLPFPQKGTAVSLPLGTSAPVLGIGPAVGDAGTGVPVNVKDSLGGSSLFGNNFTALYANAQTISGTEYPDIYADLSAATAATINSIRLAFQVQKLLERDARGGTRYTEIVRSHFGVVSPDARLQRPEYLGGGSQMISVNAIPQTSETATTPLGALGATAQVVARNGFTQSFTEHGYVIGLCNVRADLTYQQGLRRMWSRSTRYDFYWPAFAMLGEQTVLNQEIYVQGTANDLLVFGYQERWAEYRYSPSQITGLFRSTAATSLDVWHLSQEFGALPTLNSTFIQDDTNTVLNRVLATEELEDSAQLLLDCLFDMRVARPMPMYSVPGLIDHF